MIRQSLRKLASLLFIVLGAMFVGESVDITPVIGSPQIDYPTFDFNLPFWPQLALAWLVLGCGGGLLAALGLLAWSDEAARPPTLRQIAVVLAWLFTFVAGLRLVEFLAFGTMGPLHIRQPIFRFAVTQGLVSAIVVTVEWIIGSLALTQVRDRPPWIGPVAALVGVGLGLTALMLGLIVATGLPWQRTFAHWWPATLILAPAAGLLVSLTRRENGP